MVHHKNITFHEYFSKWLPQPKPSLQDLARLFLSLLGSRDQWDAVAGSAFSAATGSSAGSLSGPAVPVPVAAPSACLSAECARSGWGLSCWCCFRDRLGQSEEAL